MTHLNHILGHDFPEDSFPPGQVEVSAGTALGHFHQAVPHGSAPPLDIPDHLTYQVGCNHGMTAHGDGFQYRKIRQHLRMAPGSQGVFQRMNMAEPRLLHTLFDNIGYTGNGDRYSRTIPIQFFQEGHNFIPVVEGALDNGSVGHPA